MLAPSEHSSAAPAATAPEQQSQPPPQAESDNEPITQPVEEDQLSTSGDIVEQCDEKTQNDEAGADADALLITGEPDLDSRPSKCDKKENDIPSQSQVTCESVQERVDADKPAEGNTAETEGEENVENLREVIGATSLEKEEEEKLISFERNETEAEKAEVEVTNSHSTTEEDEGTAKALPVNVTDCDSKPDVEIKVTPPSGSCFGGEGEVVQILHNLEALKTPEPEEVENGTVRASFVQFDLSENDGPLEEQSDSDQDDDDTAVEEVDEGVEGDAGSNNNDNDNELLIGSVGAVNPELQRIREEQVRNWLIFEQENPTGDNEDVGHSEGESPSSGSIEADSLVETRTNGALPIVPLHNGHFNDEDSPIIADGEEEGEDLMMNGVDGMPRRVRFLTDQEGNLLISVFMSKLVKFFLFLIKILSVGYFDFQSVTKSFAPKSTTSTHQTSSQFCNPSLKSSSSPSSSSSSTSSLSSSDSVITIVEPETERAHKPDHMIHVPYHSTPTAQLSEDSSSILSNGGEEIITEADLQNPSLVVSPPPQDTHHGPSAPPIENGAEASNLVLMEPMLTMKEPPQEKPPPIPPNVEEDEGCNSSDETLSVSSCNSMIEILPGKVTAAQVTDVMASMEPDVIVDENNNEVKALADFSVEADKSMSSVTTCFQLSTGGLSHHITESIEEVTEEETASDASSSQPPSFIVHEPIGVQSDGTVESSSPLDNDSCPPEVAKLPIIDENNNVVEEPLLRPKFHHPALISQMPELRQGTWSSSDDGDDERMTPPAEIPPPPRPAQAFLGGVLGSSQREDQEQQMVSLCIQEEHISAVALTIAKWESMSKAQSTENLSTSVSPTSGHAPVSKTSSSPCPIKVHKPLMQTLSAKSVQPAPPQSPVQVQHVIVNANVSAEKAPSLIPVPKKVPPTNNSTVTCNQKVVLAQNAVNNGHNHPNGESLILGKAPGWNCWGNKVNDGHQNKNADQIVGGIGGERNGACDEIIYAQPNLQAGSTMTSISNPSAILKTYPKPLSKREILMWMKEGEIQRAGLLLNYAQSHHHAPAVPSGANAGSPVLVSWFFGLISRQQAERYLHGQPSGTFLVRISTRIWGYTLSYQASSGRTKHFLISATNPAIPATLQAMTDSAPFPPQTGKQQRMSPFLPQGRYAFIGTNMTPYGSLVSLIRHHSHAPITKLGGEKLINSCPGGPQVAGMDALFK